jgi:hypothetical protein
MSLLTAKELVLSYPDLDLKIKKDLIEVWADSYFEMKGKQPHPVDLMILADWLLEVELKDKSRSKVQNKPYPILSKPQIERRYRELSLDSDMVDVLHLRKMIHQPTRKKDSKNNEY